TIACDPQQYANILDAVQSSGGTDLALRKRLAGEAFAHTALYDRAIADYFSGQLQEEAEVFPETWGVAYRRKATLRYGENPHQQAAIYVHPRESGTSLVSARQLNGKE